MRKVLFYINQINIVIASLFGIYFILMGSYASFNGGCNSNILPKFPFWLQIVMIANMILMGTFSSVQSKKKTEEETNEN